MDAPRTSASSHPGRKDRIPAWLVAARPPWVRRAFSGALGPYSGNVDWIPDRDRWLAATTPLRLVVCDDVTAPGLLEGIRLATRWPGDLVVLTTDDPIHVRSLIGTGVTDCLCLPAHRSEVQPAIAAALRGPRARLERDIELLGHPLLRGALRRAVASLEPGTTPPPHTNAALARMVNCSPDYLGRQARREGLAVGYILRSVTLLRAVEEVVLRELTWLEAAEAAGYRDSSFLRKRAHELLGCGLDEIDAICRRALLESLRRTIREAADRESA